MFLSASRGRIVVVGAAAAGVLVLAGGVALASRVGGSPGTDHAAGAAPLSWEEPAQPPASPSATATASPSPRPSPSRTASPAPTRSRKPAASHKKKAPPPPPKKVVVAKPPPAPPRSAPPGPTTPEPTASCPKLNGPSAPKSEVRKAMEAAAKAEYRPTLSLDDTSPPAITVRLLLIEGIGWEESGWQSTIESCDGGLGTMQVMPATATWMNEKYGTDNDRASLAGNINIGTGYLAWLTRYFGDKYFDGDYGLAGSPDKVVLLDLVISAYQAGFGSVDVAIAAGKDLPNWWYVETVEGFMTHQPWTGAT